MPRSVSTLEQAQASGFSLIPGMNTLLTHARYPGMLFKIVSTIEQAVAIGGIALVDAVRGRDLLLFGLAASGSVAKGDLGAVYYPQSFGVSAILPKTPWRAQYAEYTMLNARYSIIANEPDLLPHHFADESVPVVGIVSRAHSGFVMCDIGTPDDRSLFTLPNGVLQQTGFASVAAAPLGQLATDLAYSNGGRLIGGYRPRFSGVLNYFFPVDKKEYLKYGRANFEAQIALDTENDQVTSRVMDAYDVVMAAQTGSVLDGVTIHPYTDDGSAILWHTDTHAAPKFTFLNHTLKVPLYMLTRESLPQDTSQLEPPTGTEAFLLGNKAHITRSGLPVPHVHVAWNAPGPTVYAYPTRPGGSPGFRAVPDVTRPAYSLSAIPYASVKFSSTSVLAASAVFGPFSPVTGPGTSVEGTELDLKQRVLDQLASVMSTEVYGSLTIPLDATDPDKVALLNAASATERDRHEGVDMVLDQLSPFAAFITRVVNEIDKLVTP